MPNASTEASDRRAARRAARRFWLARLAFHGTALVVPWNLYWSGCDGPIGTSLETAINLAVSALSVVVIL